MKNLFNLILDNLSWKGAIIIGLSLLPSIIMAFLPPINLPETKGKIVLTVFETVGRIAIMVILLFSKKSFDRKIDIWFVLMCIFGLLYYIGWIRHFCFGRTYELLYKPMFFIPVPLAFFPIMAFAFAAIWGRSIPLGIAVLVMAVGHIPQSYIYYTKIK